MKKKIAIFGSTGSIGKSLVDIIKKDKKNYLITLLTANKNYKELIKQAKYFNVKNLITGYLGNLLIKKTQEFLSLMIKCICLMTLVMMLIEQT